MPPFGRLSLPLFALASALSIGCSSNDTAPDLLRVVDVAPRELESGDRLEVLGTNLPTGDARDATITFRGTMHRPGEAPIEGQTIIVDKARITTDKVSAAVTDGLVARFCGQGDEAAHTTFHGDVTVTLDTKAEGALPVSGSVKDVTIDVRPKAPRRAIALGRERDGSRALDLLGISVSPDAPMSNGLVVAAVRPDSPAASARIQAGDVITSFDGVRVSSISDMVPSGETRAPLIAIRRGAEEPSAVPISIDGFHASAPSDLLGAAIVLGLAAAVLLFSSTPLAAFFSWLARRIAMRVAARGIGKRAFARAVGRSLVAEVRDEIENEIAPRDGEPILARLAPFVAFLGISATFVVMPFGRKLVGADLDVGMLFIIALSALVGLGLVTGGSSASEPWSILRALRGAFRILVQELAAIMAIACVVVTTGSLRLEDIVAAQGGQSGSPLDAGGWPWHWFVFRNPASFLLFAAYVSALVTADGRKEPALPEAEATTSPKQKMGTRQLLFLFGEWAHVFVACGLAGALFLGGWQLPGVPGGTVGDGSPLKIVGALLFLAKSWALVLFVVWLRSALPRLSAAARARLALRVSLPLSLFALALALGSSFVTTWLGNGRNVGLVSGVLTFVTWAFGAAYLVRRVQTNLRETRVPLHLNPLL